ncbi:uncharacterized protein LOC125248670 isoform X4 [Megalobrama amblycephala]|uniref:uncharacterized protein LOC125248670 isoform X4 n=1 Tax=Megalobrama amblycephala TaxID=75352 RepID=UPI0020146ADC|nr:uncharacterized protein LOC125248670 isoform X4 [Megalobrama amblycephala]
MEFIKEEIEDMSDPEPSRIKHEETEEQIDWMEMKPQKHELNEAEEEKQSIKTQRTKDLVLWASVSHSDHHSSHLQ